MLILGFVIALSSTCAFVCIPTLGAVIAFVILILGIVTAFVFLVRFRLSSTGEFVVFIVRILTLGFVVAFVILVPFRLSRARSMSWAESPTGPSKYVAADACVSAWVVRIHILGFVVAFVLFIRFRLSSCWRWFLKVCRGRSVPLGVPLGMLRINLVLQDSDIAYQLLVAREMRLSKLIHLQRANILASDLKANDHRVCSVYGGPPARRTHYVVLPLRTVSGKLHQMPWENCLIPSSFARGYVFVIVSVERSCQPLHPLAARSQDEFEGKLVAIGSKSAIVKKILPSTAVIAMMRAALVFVIKPSLGPPALSKRFELELTLYITPLRPRPFLPNDNDVLTYSIRKREVVPHFAEAESSIFQRRLKRDLSSLSCSWAWIVSRKWGLIRDLVVVHIDLRRAVECVFCGVGSACWRLHVIQAGMLRRGEKSKRTLSLSLATMFSSMDDYAEGGWGCAGEEQCLRQPASRDCVEAAGFSSKLFGGMPLRILHKPQLTILAWFFYKHEFRIPVAVAIAVLTPAAIHTHHVDTIIHSSNRAPKCPRLQTALDSEEPRRRLEAVIWHVRRHAQAQQIELPAITIAVERLTSNGEFTSAPNLDVMGVGIAEQRRSADLANAKEGLLDNKAARTAVGKATDQQWSGYLTDAQGRLFGKERDDTVDTVDTETAVEQTMVTDDAAEKEDNLARHQAWNGQSLPVRRLECRKTGERRDERQCGHASADNCYRCVVCGVVGQEKAEKEDNLAAPQAQQHRERYHYQCLRHSSLTSQQRISCCYGELRPDHLRDWNLTIPCRFERLGTSDKSLLSIEGCPHSIKIEARTHEVVADLGHMIVLRYPKPQPCPYILFLAHKITHPIIISPRHLHPPLLFCPRLRALGHQPHSSRALDEKIRQLDQSRDDTFHYRHVAPCLDISIILCCFICARHLSTLSIITFPPVTLSTGTSPPLPLLTIPLAFPLLLPLRKKLHKLNPYLPIPHPLPNNLINCIQSNLAYPQLLRHQTILHQIEKILHKHHLHLIPRKAIIERLMYSISNSKFSLLFAPLSTVFEDVGVDVDPVVFIGFGGVCTREDGFLTDIAVERKKEQGNSGDAERAIEHGWMRGKIAMFGEDFRIRKGLFERAIVSFSLSWIKTTVLRRGSRASQFGAAYFRSTVVFRNVPHLLFRQRELRRSASVATQKLELKDLRRNLSKCRPSTAFKFWRETSVQAPADLNTLHEVYSGIVRWLSFTHGMSDICIRELGCPRCVKAGRKMFVSGTASLGHWFRSMHVYQNQGNLAKALLCVLRATSSLSFKHKERTHTHRYNLRIQQPEAPISSSLKSNASNHPRPLNSDRRESYHFHAGKEEPSTDFAPENQQSTPTTQNSTKQSVQKKSIKLQTSNQPSATSAPENQHSTPPTTPNSPKKSQQKKPIKVQTPPHPPFAANSSPPETQQPPPSSQPQPPSPPPPPKNPQYQPPPPQTNSSSRNPNPTMLPILIFTFAFTFLLLGYGCGYLVEPVVRVAKAEGRVEMGDWPVWDEERGGVREMRRRGLGRMDRWIVIGGIDSDSNRWDGW
ncbi:uncharacterized protein MYCFIDRAFT_180165 [Pseudocercospora fijiensis CIRAD86]|uniref:Uncharacterized protein n=1 Tax=Pseudocercospora fijiensis (strain CIRAD86) TaxID=383855 RepID=M2ZYG6_PSEFD|nr:uncharacterized protein MYCFIDRAFT_180165 [Pseudocercospora fijiensis CIRAD86]EME77156.1 hypothetical protein MYCFIDRAFT_180165 [Pseudocercospora fijiensis CIRAD86]